MSLKIESATFCLRSTGKFGCHGVYRIRILPGQTCVHTSTAYRLEFLRLRTIVVQGLKGTGLTSHIRNLLRILTAKLAVP